MATMEATDEFTQHILDCYFRGATLPTSFAMRLVNHANALVGTDTWSGAISVDELSTANGYTVNGQALTSDATGWPTLALDSLEYQIEGKQIVWTATGGSIGPFSAMVVCGETGADNLLFFVNMPSLAITVTVGDSIGWTPKWKLDKVA